ncbi:hypothetical protein Hanom_Chr03g00243181 [Helianthus anomalus]
MFWFTPLALTNGEFWYKPPNHPIPIQKGPGLFLNSHVYWLGDGQVYGFDLNTETFELFPSPKRYYQESKLGVLKGRLSLTLIVYLGLEVWLVATNLPERFVRQDGLNAKIQTGELS